MSDWLAEVTANHGEKCTNCGTWRILRDGYIEECTNCGDEGYDVYSIEDVNEMLRSADV
jgi:hypothetical protein